MNPQFTAKNKPNLAEKNKIAHDEIFAYKSFGGVTESRDAAWRAPLTCQ